MLPNAHCEFDISITYNKLWHIMMPNPHIEEQLYQVKSYHDHLSWSHFCQLGELIDYHKDGIHFIPFK
jgi:hypothetical protein